MKEKIIQILQDLQKYALEKNYEVSIFYHEEDSYLMRFANSAISLNTNEHLIRLFIDAYDGNKKASYTLITDINKIDEMKQGIDTVAEMVGHSQPLNYTPTVPVFKGDFIDEEGFDAEQEARKAFRALRFDFAVVDGWDKIKSDHDGLKKMISKIYE